MSYQRDTPHEHIAHASAVETIKNALEIAHTVSQPTPRAWSRARSALCPRPAARLGHAQHHESTCSSATPRQPQHHLPAPQQQTPPQQPLQDAREIPSHPHGETRTRTGDTTIFSRVLYQLSYLAASGRCYRLAAPPAARGDQRLRPRRSAVFPGFEIGQRVDRVPAGGLPAADPHLEVQVRRGRIAGLAGAGRAAARRPRPGRR